MHCKFVHYKQVINRPLKHILSFKSYKHWLRPVTGILNPPILV